MKKLLIAGMLLANVSLGAKKAEIPDALIMQEVDYLYTSNRDWRIKDITPAVDYLKALKNYLDCQEVIGGEVTRSGEPTFGSLEKAKELDRELDAKMKVLSEDAQNKVREAEKKIAEGFAINGNTSQSVDQEKLMKDMINTYRIFIVKALQECYQLTDEQAQAAFE